MITFSQKGDFHKVDNFFERLLQIAKMSKLDRYGKEGVEALRDATPVDSGMTRDCWYYEISHKDGVSTISFLNSNINDGVPNAWKEVTSL